MDGIRGTARRGRRGPLLAALLLVVLAPAVGGCGDGGDDGGDAGSTTTLPEVVSADALPVLVAAAPIPAGTEATVALEEGLLEEDTVTRAQFPEDAIVTIELIEGQVASGDIGEGAIITAGMFVERRPAG